MKFKLLQVTKSFFMKQKYVSWFLVAGIAAIIFFIGCKKSNNGTPQADVVINSISPDSGPYSTSVTITGSGFSSNAVDNKVKFNNKDAVVQTASVTQIIATVPKGAGSGPVTVQVGSKTATGPLFNYNVTITVSTLAGSGTGGFADGIGIAAQFYTPTGVALDAQSNIYVADPNNYRIRKITASGIVSTLAGNGTYGFVDGNGTTAQFKFPVGAALDAQGNIYVADADNNRIRKITASGIVSTLAGSGTAGFADGNGPAAQFNSPNGVALDAQGNIYVADDFNNRIRKITSSGIVSTLAGSGTYGFADGNGPAAQFNSPAGVALDAQGNIYVADANNHRIRKITASGIVSTLAGSGTQGFADGNGPAAQFHLPYGVALDAQDNIYVADALNNRIRKITASGLVSTLAGSGTQGFADGNGTTAQFYTPAGVALDAQGNIYVAEIGNNRIRKITIE